MRDFFYTLFRPKHWDTRHSVNTKWDQLLNLAIDTYGVEVLDKYYAKVGNYKVWTANYPYSFGYEVTVSNRLFPSARTKDRLYRLVKSAKANGIKSNGLQQDEDVLETMLGITGIKFDNDLKGLLK